MTASANAVDVPRQPIRFAGFPFSAWAFGGRTWLSMVLALYVAFWLELGAPSTAALTTAVLAFPARGQTIEKAAFRLFATAIGLTASITITAMFAQTDWLLIAALATWIGICAYAASLFDGFRNYAAVLCIITVCLIAIEPIDAPQDVFDNALQRGAAIVIGILSVALINTAFAAPDYYPAIAARLEGLQRKVAALASDTMAGIAVPPSRIAALLQEITALRPEITTLAAESSVGGARHAAARSAMVDLVLAVAASRAIAASRGATASAAPAAQRAVAWMTSELSLRDRDVAALLAALRKGVVPPRAWRAPFYRSHRIARANGARAAIYFALSAAVLVFAGWPSTSVALAFVGILIGLSTMSPNQAAAAMLALVAVSVGCVLAGILEFVVLDGVEAFPLLAIGIAPFVVVPALLMTIPNPALVSFARSNLVFSIAIFEPSNPQSYDPQSYLLACVFLCTAAFLLFVCQRLLPPLSMAARLRLLASEARRDLASMTARASRGIAPEEAAFRDAVRIGQLVVAAGPAASDEPLIETAIDCFDRAYAIRLVGVALDMLPPDTPSALRKAAAAAVRERDGRALLAVSQDLSRSASPGSAARDNASAALAAAGMILLPPPSVHPR